MTIIQAIILGTVQGLTEFLPISSSAHLNLFPWLLKWQEMPESFDVALHIGTLLAIIVYFFKDWIRLIAGGYKQVVKKEKTTDGRIFWYLVIATVPAGILSLILDKIVDKIIGNNLNLEMIIISMALIIRKAANNLFSSFLSVFTVTKNTASNSDTKTAIAAITSRKLNLSI